MHAALFYSSNETNSGTIFAPGFQHTPEKNDTQKPDWVKHKYKYDNIK
jgi:hypothetical protein